jgi:hypothetical protein
MVTAAHAAARAAAKHWKRWSPRSCGFRSHAFWGASAPALFTFNAPHPPPQRNQHCVRDASCSLATQCHGTTTHALAIPRPAWPFRARSCLSCLAHQSTGRHGDGRRLVCAPTVSATLLPKQAPSRGPPCTAPCQSARDARGPARPNHQSKARAHPPTTAPAHPTPFCRAPARAGPLARSRAAAAGWAAPPALLGQPGPAAAPCASGALLADDESSPHPPLAGPQASRLLERVWRGGGRGCRHLPPFRCATHAHQTRTLHSLWDEKMNRDVTCKHWIPLFKRALMLLPGRGEAGVWEWLPTQVVVWRRPRLPAFRGRGGGRAVPGRVGGRVGGSLGSCSEGAQARAQACLARPRPRLRPSITRCPPTVSGRVPAKYGISRGALGRRPGPNPHELQTAARPSRAPMPAVPAAPRPATARRAAAQPSCPPHARTPPFRPGSRARTVRAVAAAAVLPASMGPQLGPPGCEPRWLARTALGSWALGGPMHGLAVLWAYCRIGLWRACRRARKAGTP